MVRRIATVALLLGLMGLCWAEQSATEFAQTASDRITHQRHQGLEIEWRGLGPPAGEVLEARFHNGSSDSMEIRLVPGMVLSSPEEGIEPLMLEGVVAFQLKPGEKVSRKLRGYGLDHSKRTPRGKVRYGFADGSSYEPAVKTLWAGLRMEKKGETRPVLSTIQYRTIVLQRAIWASLGGLNPSTEEKLRLDLLEDKRAGGHSFSEEKVDWLASWIWRDVEAIREAAKREA